MPICVQYSNYATFYLCTHAAGSDYIQDSQVLTLSSSTVAQTVTIAILDDDANEEDETFEAVMVLVNSQDEAFVNLQPNKTTITILDDDPEGWPHLFITRLFEHFLSF